VASRVVLSSIELDSLSGSAGIGEDVLQEDEMNKLGFVGMVLDKSGWLR
jgi:hypothetical protein